jgi:hypothetical protein
MVVALERPNFEAASEALPFVEWTLTLLLVMQAVKPKTVRGSEDGEVEYESDGNKGRVEKIPEYEGDVAPQSRAECTVSLETEMSVKLTGRER